MIDTYNEQVFKWEHRGDRDANVDDFVLSDEAKIKWSSGLKQKLQSGQIAEFTDTKIRQSLYRPFTKSNLYFDRMVNDRVLVFPSILPTPETETENRVILFLVLVDSSDFGVYAQTGFQSKITSIDGSNAFPFTPTTKTGGTAARTSPIGR